MEPEKKMRSLVGLIIWGILSGCGGVKIKELESRIDQLERRVEVVELVPLELNFIYNEETQEREVAWKFKQYGYINSNSVIYSSSHFPADGTPEISKLKGYTLKFGYGVSTPVYRAHELIRIKKPQTIVKKIDINDDGLEDIAVYDGERLEFFIAGKEENMIIYKIRF